MPVAATLDTMLRKWRTEHSKPLRHLITFAPIQLVCRADCCVLIVVNPSCGHGEISPGCGHVSI
jgi:hypothetical protein